MQITERVTEIILQWVLVRTLITNSISTSCKHLMMLQVLNISSCLLTKKKVLSMLLELILLHSFFNIHRSWFFNFFSTSRMSIGIQSMENNYLLASLEYSCTTGKYCEVHFRAFLVKQVYLYQYSDEYCFLHQLAQGRNITFEFCQRSA